MVRLLVFHYHDRPGGVREVIGRGLPLLVKRLLGAGEEVSGVDFLAGELTDADWRAGLEQSLARTTAAAVSGLKGTPLRWSADTEWGYGSQDFGELSAASRSRLREILTPRFSAAGKRERTVLWAHNLSVGRNIPLLRALPALCQEAGAELWLHHHDWWWDGRWARWRDWRAAGVDSLDEALPASVPSGPHIRHFCVNRADLPFLEATAGSAAVRWVGNPLPPLTPPAAADVQAARRWLNARTGGRPVWLAPVRALRRKNLAEALLITRRLAPDACLVTTAGCSSPDEAPAWQNLLAAAERHGWPLIPGVLSGEVVVGGGGNGFNSRPPVKPPSVAALMAASDAVILTSLQEGFGLPWLEAAALEKPVISRRLPEVAANLAGLGCGLSGTWNSLPVPDFPKSCRASELARVSRRRKSLLSMLPEGLRESAFSTAVNLPGSADPGEAAESLTDFGQLTLDGQLEILSRPVGGFHLPPEVEATVPVWPVDCRQDRWADLFLGAEPVNRRLPGGGSAGQGAQHAELLRRLNRWLQHPLLWPD